MKSMKKTPRGKAIDDRGDDVPTQPPRYKEDDKSDAQRVGAFAVAGNDGATSGQAAWLSSNNLHSDAEDDKDAPIVAHVVDEEAPPMMPASVEATPLGESQHLKALLQSRKCRIILALTLVLIIGVIVAIVVVTQSGSKAAPPTQAPSKDNAADKFLSELKPLLSSESLTALDDPDSAQNRSLAWLLERSNFQTLPFHRQVQRYAMGTIYYATGGPSWTKDENWLTDVSECTWAQASPEKSLCGERDTLQTLDLSNNTLDGMLPDEIGLLSSLMAIDLSENKISGILPSELGSLTALTFLDLGMNAFTKTVPLELGSLTNLTVLSLYHNSFVGTVPSELGYLTALSFLSVSTNEFSGTVPSEIGFWTHLSFLSLYQNSFKGTMPSELGSLTALTELYLDGNEFTGAVPSELGYLKFLTNLTLSTNFFTGEIPTELDSLPALTYLGLSGNSLNGTEQETICSLANTSTVEIFVDCPYTYFCKCCVCG